MTCTGWTLTSEGKIRVEQIVQDIEEDESVQAAMTGPNSKSNKRNLSAHLIRQFSEEESGRADFR